MHCRVLHQRDRSYLESSQIWFGPTVAGKRSERGFPRIGGEVLRCAIDFRSMVTMRKVFCLASAITMISGEYRRHVRRFGRPAAEGLRFPLGGTVEFVGLRSGSCQETSGASRPLERSYSGTVSGPGE